MHRVVQHFIRPFVGSSTSFQQDYIRWLDERSQRLFVYDLNSEVLFSFQLFIVFHFQIPAFRLLSPRVDPDLLPLVRHRERPELRREMHSHVGELPLPAEIEMRQEQREEENLLATMQLPRRYPRGKRY